jgi:hypothetical protein
MDRPTPEQYEAQIAELATFCFRKIANLETRFIILCHRAESAGIDCADLRSPEAPSEEAGTALRVVN